ncbi:hypothetical protein ACQKGC_10790 [Allorhizobium pseudoryzae]|jgi:hypothetical protein|nr:hypothetical protein [Allorhizobium pseudoryzae]
MLPVWCAAVVLMAGLFGVATYGWMLHGADIFLAMSDSLAAWCM